MSPCVDRILVLGYNLLTFTLLNGGQGGEMSEVNPHSSSQTTLHLIGKEPNRPEFEPVLDTEEAASLLGIHPKTLQKLARAKKVPAVRIGKCWAFRASALDAWLKSKLAS
jgi:excisionase family DNA binding protein